MFFFHVTVLLLFQSSDCRTRCAESSSTRSRAPTSASPSVPGGPRPKCGPRPVACSSPTSSGASWVCPQWHPTPVTGCSHRTHLVSLILLQSTPVNSYPDNSDLRLIRTHLRSLFWDDISNIIRLIRISHYSYYFIPSRAIRISRIPLYYHFPPT